MITSISHATHGEYHLHGFKAGMDLIIRTNHSYALDGRDHGNEHENPSTVVMDSENARLI